MGEHQKQTEFLKHCLRYHESATREELNREITQIQRDQRCVQRAVWLMAVLTALAVVGLGYPAILLENFPYSPPQFFVNLCCAVGVGSLISLFAFAGLWMVYRKKLDQRKEQCRQMLTTLLESRLGNPVSTPWGESPVSDRSRGVEQVAAPDNGSPAGFESAAQG